MCAPDILAGSGGNNIEDGRSKKENRKTLIIDKLGRKTKTLVVKTYLEGIIFSRFPILRGVKPVSFIFSSPPQSFVFP